jgi:hypothetical protein
VKAARLPLFLQRRSLLPLLSLQPPYPPWLLLKTCNILAVRRPLLLGFAVVAGGLPWSPSSAFFRGAASSKMDKGFKTWEGTGDDAAEIFRLLYNKKLPNLRAQRKASWQEYSALKKDWIGTIYKRARLNDNFNSTFNRYQAWKETGSGRCCGLDCFDRSLSYCLSLASSVAGEREDFLAKAGIGVPLKNPTPSKTGGIRPGSDHGSFATTRRRKEEEEDDEEDDSYEEEEDVPRRITTLALRNNDEEEPAGVESVAESVVEELSAHFEGLGVLPSLSKMRVTTIEDEVTIRNPQFVSQLETRKRLIVIVHLISGVPRNGQGVEMKLEGQWVTVFVPLDNGLFNAATLFSNRLGIARGSTTISRIQAAFAEETEKLEKNSTGQLCQTTKFKVKFPVEESFRMSGTNLPPMPSQDPIEILQVRNPLDQSVSSLLAVGFLLGKRNENLKVIESTPAASSKTVHAVVSSGLQVSPFVIGAASSPRRDNRPKRARRPGPVQFQSTPEDAFSGGLSPDSQSFMDANSTADQTNNNLNDSNETDDSYVQRFFG